MFCLSTVSTNVLITYKLPAFFKKKKKLQHGKERKGKIERKLKNKRVENTDLIGPCKENKVRGLIFLFSTTLLSHFCPSQPAERV